MSIFNRLKNAIEGLKRPEALSWSWRGGVSTSSGMLFDGSKFSGSAIYPGVSQLDNSTIRAKSRLAYWDSTQARAILSRLKESVVGTGLSLEAAPVWRFIAKDLGEEEKQELIKEIEDRFHLYANSKEADATGRLTLYELTAFEFLNRLRDGETISIFRYSADPLRMSPLNIQFIEPDQVISPYDTIQLDVIKSQARIIWEGFELDPAGRELAVWIANNLGVNPQRVPVIGPSGRRFVNHALVADTLGAVRGTPILGPLVHELQKITDYTVAEIEAAVINAVFAVWVKPSADANASKALTGIQLKKGAAAPDATKSDTSQAVFNKPGIIVQSLKAGEEMESFDTKRPNVNFKDFVDAVTRSLSASVGIPAEVLYMMFNQNYSASRACLLLFWNVVDGWIASCANQFLNNVYQAWFNEAVKSGDLKAIGFDGKSPLIKAAWLNCSWIGITKPALDPYKEAQADDLRINQGALTRERNAENYNGSDFNDNVSRLQIENEKLSQANKSMSGPKPAPGAGNFNINPAPGGDPGLGDAGGNNGDGSADGSGD